VVLVASSLFASQSACAQNTIGWAQGYPKGYNTQMGPPAVLGKIEGMGTYAGFGPPGIITAATFNWMLIVNGQGGAVNGVQCNAANNNIGVFDTINNTWGPATAPNLSAGTYEVWFTIFYQVGNNPPTGYKSVTRQVTID
jgi:hypothetical protein